MDDARYLLVKRGLYYRPNNQGYTGVKSDAGRYRADEAYEGVTAVHEDKAGEFAPACWQETIIATLRAELATARAEGERIGRERERAEIVAWLRDRFGCDVDCADGYAARIERGGHITEAS